MSALPTSPATHRVVSLPDVDIALTEYGEGTQPTVLLLHGLGSRTDSWDNVIDALADEFHVVALDLRGHGASSRPAHSYLPPDYAADLQGVLEALDLAKPLIVGHSLGGIITLEWASRHPTRAAGLVIEDSPLRANSNVAPVFDDGITLNAMSVEEAAAYYQQEHPEWSAEECRDRAEAITSVAAGVYSDLKAAMNGPDAALANGQIVANLAAIESPTLLIYGDIETGGMVGPADADTFARTLPHAETAHIPGGSHGLHRNHSDAFLAAALPFLRAHRP